MPSPGRSSGSFERVTGNPLWQLIGGTVQGAAHLRANKPNQDAIACKALGPSSSPGAGVLEARAIVAAVADGHGGERHPRSDRGAQLAVEAALAVVEKFAASQKGRPVSAVLRAARRTLPRLITRRWRKMIDRESGHLAPAGPDRYVPYGATVLAAVVTEKYLLYLQLGDGDILTVLPDGNVHRPIPAFPGQGSAKETSSLCQDICEGLFRFALQPLNESTAAEIPSLILLATDGYSNSFRSDEGFLSVARDLQDKADAHSLEEVRERLDGWLQETSHAGSGDDITVAVLRRVEARDARAGISQVPAADLDEPSAATTLLGVTATTSTTLLGVPSPPDLPPRPQPPPLPPRSASVFAPPGPPPESPQRLRRRLRQTQVALAASVALWVITTVFALSGSDQEPAEPERLAQGVSVERLETPPATPPPATPPSSPAAPAPSSPPSAPNAPVATTAAAKLAMAPARKRRVKASKKQVNRSRRMARANRRSKPTTAQPATPAAIKPVMRVPARKPVRTRG